MDTRGAPGRRSVATRPSRGENSPGSAGPWGVGSYPTQGPAAPGDTLRSLYLTLPMPLVCLAADRTITFMNPAACELLGYDSGELERLPSWLLCGSGHDAELLVPQAGSPVPGVAGAQAAPFVLKRRDGTEFPAEVTTFWLIADPHTQEPAARQPPVDATLAPAMSVTALLVRDLSDVQ